MKLSREKSDLAPLILRSYGFNEQNRETLDTFLHHHYAQGLSPRRIEVEDLLHAEAMELFKI